MNAVTNDCRLEIAKGYAKVIAAIDDAIYEEENGKLLLSSLYDGIRHSCDNTGILCHMHQYPKGVYIEDDDVIVQQIEKAVTLAKAAGVVILDWFLGDVHGTASSSHAVAVLKKLEDDAAVRFVVIYTDQKAVDVDVTLTREFPRIRPLLYSSTLEPTSMSDILVVQSNEKILKGTEENEQEYSQQDEPNSTLTSAITAPQITESDMEEEDDPFGIQEDGILTDKVTIIEDTAAAPQNSTYNYEINNRLFIFVRNKHVLSNPEDLVSEIHQSLSHVFQDSLHWAGLEIATRARDMLPSVIANLPVGTNDALYYQLLHQKTDEVAGQVADSLTDELRFHLQQKPLAAVQDEALLVNAEAIVQDLLKDIPDLLKTVKSKSDNWKQAYSKFKGYASTKHIPSEEMKRYLEDLEPLLQEAIEGISADSLRRYITEGQDKVPCDCDSEQTGNFCVEEVRQTVYQRLRKKLKEQQQTPSHVAWATTRESVLFVSSASAPETGFVYKTENGNHPQWLLCVTPGCDCYRPTGNGYLFIGGRTLDLVERHNEAGSSSNETQTCIDQQQVVWDSSRLVVGDENFLEQNYMFIGAIRYPFAMRIIQRLWTYQSRVAIDTSELLRERRKER